MRVRTPSDVVVNQPLRVQRPQDTEHVHVRVGIENVVNHTLGRKRNTRVRTRLASGNRNSTGCRLRARDEVRRRNSGRKVCVGPTASKAPRPLARSHRPEPGRELQNRQRTQALGAAAEASARSGGTGEEALTGAEGQRANGQRVRQRPGETRWTSALGGNPLLTLKSKV